ncbi:FUSC family protein [Amycolatopsis taiwanensis]|uniref:FUSC family protein n=1 Tax=Amycolatopsis taiwanensis TaxID=342230 RepID=A0A9W6VH65_9PSEU|nr:FUSC family protein [Amycolatopsis taiwanensis]GLY66714.1 FUSC family protein [Amycolatopsis taiwanensis]
MPVNLETLRVARERLVAADPGLVRLRLAVWAVLSIALSAVVLNLLHRPLQVIPVAGVAAMQSAFTVNDRTRGAQAVTLVLATSAGAVSLTAAAFGSLVPPLNYFLFIVLIFLAVYAQRFAPRGSALGALPFFMFFLAMFLQVRPAQLPLVLEALAIGVASHALVRFVFLPRRPSAELLRVRRAFRARLGAVARAAAAYLAGGGTDRRRAALRRADSRLHEAVLMIEDAISDVLDPPAAELLRRRAIEVELAAQWLSIATRRTNFEELPERVREELVESLLRFDAMIESDPRALPVISETEEFSRMLVAGSRLGEPAPGDDLRRAIAELALADVNAQRIAENDYSAEAELPGPPAPEPEPAFTFDNRTRSAVQAMIAAGLAVLGGELVSHQRWYWAVLTVFVVFLNTSTAGATVVKGFRRVAGTMVGIFGGMLLALLAAGHTTAIVVLLMLCVFGMVYTIRVSQVVGSFFITCLLGLLYSLLGTFSLEVLWVRVAETAIGAAAGLLAAVAVLPVRMRTVLRTNLEEVLEALRDLVTGAEDLMSGRENINVIELSRELDRAVETVRTTLEPLTHPMNVVSRRYYTSYVLSALNGIAFRARNLAARAEPGLLAADDRLTEFVDRITGNIDVIAEAIETGTARNRLDHDPGAPAIRKSDDSEIRAVLTSLDRLDEWIVALGRALGIETANGDGGRRQPEPPPAVAMISIARPGR